MVIVNQKVAPGGTDKVTGSIAHARDILVCLSSGINKVSDIARQTSFSKSTVHRVLKLLEQSQMAVQDAINRRYYLGPLVMKLSSNALTSHQRLITCADTEMKRLSYATEESVVLDIMMGLKYMLLYEIPSRHNLKLSLEASRPNALYTSFYAGASVKVMLAQLDDNKLKKLIEIINIPRVTERTVTDKKVLLSQILDVRKVGYAVSRSERILGGFCVAVPVFNYVLPVSLSVAGPEIRMLPKVKSIVNELRASTLKISKNIALMFGNGNNKPL